MWKSRNSNSKAGNSPSASSPVAAATRGESAPIPFKLGVAGFTFYRRTLDDALAIMREADVHYLCVKDFHLPFTATDADIAAFREKCAAFGVAPYAIGPVYVDEAGRLREQFTFARRLGVKVVVAVAKARSEFSRSGITITRQIPMMMRATV